jgi:hypothetical protein
VAWDYDPLTQNCYTKPVDEPRVPASRYAGVIPLAPGPPPAAQPSFDDSQWEVINAPHDMLVVEVRIEPHVALPLFSLCSCPSCTITFVCN